MFVPSPTCPLRNANAKTYDNSVPKIIAGESGTTKRPEKGAAVRRTNEMYYCKRGHLFCSFESAGTLEGRPSIIVDRVRFSWHLEWASTRCPLHENVHRGFHRKIKKIKILFVFHANRQRINTISNINFVDVVFSPIFTCTTTRTKSS